MPGTYCGLCRVVLWFLVLSLYPRSRGARNRGSDSSFKNIIYIQHVSVSVPTFFFNASSFRRLRLRQ
uniref:Secreted protein n=1 Tax=Anopheles darlingi TaxID=43151 RepID=A0A2M4DA85_ANODA